jgi:small subunit ribosomal protein S16
VEHIGFCNPLVDPAEYRIKEARALHWLSVGAQPTDAVRRLLKKQGTLARLEKLQAGEDLQALAAQFEGVDPMARAQVDALEEESAVTEEE